MLNRRKKNINPIPALPNEPALPTPGLRSNLGKGKLKETGGQYLGQSYLLNNGDKNKGATASSGGKLPGGRPYITSEDLIRYKTAAPVGPSKDFVVNGMIPNLGELMSKENVAERSKELRRLTYHLDEWDKINDDTLLKLVDKLKANVETIDDSMSPLLEQIINGNWITRSSKIVRSVEGFMTELMVVRPGFAGQVMRSMIFRFIPPTNIVVKKPDEIPICEEKVFSIAHRNLKRIMESFPMNKESCVKTMENAYPYMGKAPHIHYCFLSNLIKSLEYVPQSKIQILQLIIHKLCRIDVNILREDVEDIIEMTNKSEMLTKIKAEGGGHIELSMDSDDFYNGGPKDVNPLVETIDLCMSQVFECFQVIVASSNDNSELDCLFESLCSTFEKELLTTFSANHVQFLYFYLISQRTDYATKFLEFLWSRATSTFNPMVVRIQALANLSGCLARAQFIPIKTVKQWLSRMADWAEAYGKVNVKKSHWSTVNIQAHFPFYAVCQALFYVFAFRNKELVGSRKCLAYTRTLNLSSLVTCNLNPLKACVGMVAEAFVNAAHIHQISYCRTILERNERATIPTLLTESLDDLGEEAAAIAMNSMECFFPFDPYLLPRSRKWIDPIFRLYEPYLPEVKIEKKETSWLPSHDDDDSIEMELSVSFKDQNSSFFSSGMINTSDIKDESMDDYID